MGEIVTNITEMSSLLSLLGIHNTVIAFDCSFKNSNGSLNK